MNTQKGNFYVIDGSDGAGKATQAGLLVARLLTEGRSVKTIDFPRYTQNHFGRLLRECLDGKRGDFLTLDPQIASLIYAADRFESSKVIREWLEGGHDVVADRYVSANMIHQGSKVSDTASRIEFLDWLDHTEHGVFEIPRPDIIIYLDVPYHVRKQLMEADTTRAALDTVEVDESYQTAHEATVIHLGELLDTWQHVSCVDGDDLRSREAIHEDVFKRVQALIHKRLEVLEG